MLARQDMSDHRHRAPCRVIPALHCRPRPITTRSLRPSQNRRAVGNSGATAELHLITRTECEAAVRWHSNNVLFLPAFNGLGAPYWNSEIRGGFYGITQDTSVEDMTTAAFQSVAFQTKDITNILSLYNIKIQKLLVDEAWFLIKHFVRCLLTHFK